MSKRSLNPIREAQTKWTAAMDDETMDEGDCELSWKCQGCLQCCVKNKDNKSTIAMKREASFQEAQFSNNFEHKEPSKYGSKMAKTIPQQAQSQTEKKREIFEGYPKEHPRIPKPPKSQKFVCPHCPRTFLKEALLQDHLRMHTGPLPYSCSVCPMLLPRAADLRKHMESHLDRRFNQNEGSTQKFDNQAKADVLEYFPRVKTKLSKLPAESLCRVCLRSSKDMVNIFEETLPPGGIALADVISQCTENSVAKGDSFPKSICRPCLVHIQAAFEIRQTFERSRRFFGMMQQQSLKEDVSKGKLQLYVEDDEASNSQSLKDADSVVDFSKISSSDPQKMSAEQSDGLDFFMEQDDCENFSKKVNDFTRRRKPKKYVDSLDSDDSINKPMEDSNDKDFDARKSEARDDDSMLPVATLPVLSRTY
ncbi:hypothetical protein KR074_012402 [Drosophila pseudoananassae]|nr:hypothetical protein KR074_012402 [Drosophila pseudoananassae]